MKEFLSTYIELLQNNHDMVGQVHSEFKRQFLEMTVDKLLEQFVLSKYTGLEKPGTYSVGRQKLNRKWVCSQLCPIHSDRLSFTLNPILSLYISLSFSVTAERKSSIF